MSIQNLTVIDEQSFTVFNEDQKPTDRILVYVKDREGFIQSYLFDKAKYTSSKIDELVKNYKP